MEETLSPGIFSSYYSSLLLEPGCGRFSSVTVTHRLHQTADFNRIGVLSVLVLFSFYCTHCTCVHWALGNKHDESVDLVVPVLLRQTHHNIGDW